VWPNLQMLTYYIVTFLYCLSLTSVVSKRTTEIRDWLCWTSSSDLSCTKVWSILWILTYFSGRFFVVLKCDFNIQQTDLWEQRLACWTSSSDLCCTKVRPNRQILKYFLATFCCTAQVWPLVLVYWPVRLEVVLLNFKVGPKYHK